MELGLRELEDKMRTKKLHHAELVRKIERMVELIKDPARTPEIKDYIERSREMYNTQSFDQHLIDLYQAGILTLEVAKAAATNPADFERALYVS